MKKHFICAMLLLLAAQLLAQAEPPFATGFRAPIKIAFTPQKNLIVAEAGSGPNTGRISLIDRTNATRRTLIDGMPSALFAGVQPPQPSGPSGLAVQGSTLYLTIGSGDGSVAGPIPGSEAANPNPSSPILSAVLSIRANRSLDLMLGNFVLDRAQHDLLKSGSTVTLTSSSGEQLEIRLIADFPNSVSEPRPDFAGNVRGSNPFGVVALGQSLYVVDAASNLIRRVSLSDGSFATLSTFAKVSNPTPVGPPQIDAVPDSIRLQANRLLVTLLTGFPFPEGRAEIRAVDLNSGANTSVASGLTSAIDVTALGDAPNSQYLVLEFSTNMLGGQPGRLRMVRPGEAPVLVADNLITPTSMVVDRVTGEVFITNLGPGIITRVRAAGTLPPAPPTSVIPAVASTAGGFGSRFQTSAQLSNPHPFAISGRIVFHPAGASAQISDPSLSYVLAPFETRSYSDLVAAIGGSGIGSADVIASVGGAPVSVIRVVDIASAAQPAVQIPQIDPAQALVLGTRGSLITPQDTAKTRFNVGIRTLDEGVTMTVARHDPSGSVVQSVARSYPPNFFVQLPVADLLGIAAGANAAVTFSIDQGSVIVYGASVDNSGQGMTLQIALPTSQ